MTQIVYGDVNNEKTVLSLFPEGAVAVISDETVAGLYAEQVCRSLQKNGRKTSLFTFPSGELSKTRATKERLEDRLLSEGFGSDTCVAAIGGGVVTDLAGFTAATYCRGVPIVMIPTTLLAMVDASLGGKNGVNTPRGKNLIGTIYQPKAVLIDPSVLGTLPPSELKNGIAEMIKHGIIADESYVSFLESHVSQLLALEAQTLAHGIAVSCRIKNQLIEEGRRPLLNFGHTVAHALERLSGYTLAHGQAVAIGMVAEGRVAVERSAFPERAYERLGALISAYGFLHHHPYDASELWKTMVPDKKSQHGIPYIVVPTDVGTACANNLAVETETLLR